MARKIAQFKDTKVSGLKIYQFGIQAPQGATVIFNDENDNKITIGSSGIFQAELPEGSYITGIQVNLPEGVNAVYYIDIVYESEDE